MLLVLLMSSIDMTGISSSDPFSRISSLVGVHDTRKDNLPFKKSSIFFRPEE